MNYHNPSDPRRGPPPPAHVDPQLQDPRVPAPWQSKHYYPGGVMAHEEERTFNAVKLFWLVWRFRWLILVLLAIGLTGGYARTLLEIPKYRATTQLEIHSNAARVIQDLAVINETSDTRAFNTAVLKLKSKELLRRAVHSLNLVNNPSFLYPPKNLALENLWARITGTTAEPERPKDGIEIREAIAIGQIRDNLTVRLMRGTSVIAIAMSNHDPKTAARISDQLALSYIDQRIDQTSETSDLASQLIRKQVGELKVRLEESEKELVVYAKDKGITENGEDGALVTGNMRSINEALGAAIQERLVAARQVKQIEAGNGKNLPEVLASEPLQVIRQEISKLRAEYRQKLNKFKPNFPEMRALRSQIGELRSQVNGGIRSILDSIKLKHQDIVAKEQNLREKLAQLEAEYAEYQDKNIQYTILKREVDSNRKQFDSLIDKLNEVNVASEIKNERAVIVERASVPGFPYAPKLSKNLILAFVLSAGLAGAIIYLFELFNNTFRSPDQIDSELGLPILGLIPKVEDVDLEEQMNSNSSAISEAFRSLRTSIQFLGPDGPPKTLVVTSSEPSEGKTTTSKKLAEEFGALGKKVLVIDADMRRPNLHRLLGVGNGMGLSNLLTNVMEDYETQRLEIFKTVSLPNVTVVTSGTPPPNPANLLSSEKMGWFVHNCSKKFDLVIIDAPPVLGISDALLLSRLADATLFVVSAHQVSRKSAQLASMRLRSAGAHISGAVLNSFSAADSSYGYNYGYMNYGYYNYGNTTPTSQRKALGNWAVKRSKSKRRGSIFDRILAHLPNTDKRNKRPARGLRPQNSNDIKPV